MEASEIFQFICASQGAVRKKELMCNLGDDVCEIVSNREKFVEYSCGRQQEPAAVLVVAWTRLRLCRARDCPGTCQGLHLCKNFLFSGSCQFSRLREGCNFSHELHSDNNQRVLREHDLERLSRTELCTLLLQSDNTLLPPICHNYNNGPGEFGRCQDGNDCKRLHVCERSLDGDCSCPKTHDFSAAQPLRNLQKRNVPDILIRSLKSVYTNITALRFSGIREDGGNRGNREQQRPNPFSSDALAAANFSDASSDSGPNFKQWHRGRGGHRGNRGNRGIRGNWGNRGNRGNRGNQGNFHQPGRACSTSDIFADIETLDLYTADGLSEDNSQRQELNSSTSDISAAANDTDASSDDGQSRKQSKKQNKTSAAARGRGGNWGNRGNRGNYQRLQKTSSTNDITSDVDKIFSNDQGPNKNQRQRPVRDKTEICMFFIKGYCKHEDKCFKAHDKMPYRWQVQEGDQWTALPNNEAIEKDYCDPNKTCSGSTPPVNFDTMTCRLNKVRRLSTINVLNGPTFYHTTEWVWYWKDELGEWKMYATGGHRAADIDSTKLEQKFLLNDKDVVEFTAGSQEYSLSFQDMIQTNKHYGTKRLVRRRPRFVSAADVQAKRVRRPLGQPKLSTIPDHWDKTQIPATGYKLIPLQCSSDEFKEIEALFCKTMRGFDMVKVERIQNKALWEVFQWQKNQMKNNSGCYTTEKKLFHGTDSKHVDAICLKNFDWRLCGTHGTAFGQGSYFARDAKYSHCYTGESDVKSMFVSRVLVGHYTKGSPDYRRPPSKDGGDVNFYDSCVDDVMNPSIFVVFEKHQIYPEYLLQYKTTHPLVLLHSAGTVPPPRQVTKPSVTVQRIGSNQPSTARYQPSTPVQPSISSYQPSTARYQPSTPVQPRNSSPPSSSSLREKKQSDSCVTA